MRTLFTLGCLFLFFSQLAAQFHLNVSLDEDRLYSVKLKSDVALNPGSIVGSGQITLTAPFGGFKIGDITSVKGKWAGNYEVLGKDYGFPLPHEYHFIILTAGSNFLDEGLAKGVEITLLTFRNVEVCTGPIEIISDTDPLIIYQDSIYANDALGGFNFYYGLDLSVWDSIKNEIYNISGVYDEKQAICDVANPNLSTSTEHLLKHSIKVQPNPIKQAAVIQFDNPSNKNYSLIINDLSGRVVRQMDGLTGDHVMVQRQDMPAGMYIAQLRDEAGNFATTKLVVE